MRSHLRPSFRLPCLLTLCLTRSLSSEGATTFDRIDLVSDVPGQAANLDPNLVNPWGVALSPTGPFWVAGNGSGLSPLYNGSGTPQALVVTVPPPAGGTPPSRPTGVVFNGGTGFTLLPGAAPARFIFATEDGTISGWNPTANPTQALLKVDNSASDAIYKGLAIGNNGSGDFLYAANFRTGTIDVFDSLYSPVSLAGSFTDPTLPSGFAPFNIQRLGSVLYVTYAKVDGTGEDDVPGAGNGFVDRFDLNGNLLNRLITGGPLNSPWGLALAPAEFGTFAGDLLVGNFGDGRINAFDPVTGVFIDTLRDASNQPLEIPGLWALTPGNGGNGGVTSSLYFTAGIQDEEHGLFGSITSAVPESPGLVPAILGSMAGVGATIRRRRSVA